MMAILRLNVPSIFVYGGSILPGTHRGNDVTVVDVFEAVGKHSVGAMSDADLAEIGLRVVVDAIDLRDPEPVHDAFLHHDLAATAILLFIVVAGYELIAKRYLRHDIPKRKVMAVGLVLLFWRKRYLERGAGGGGR